MTAVDGHKSVEVLCLPGDGIGVEVTAEAVRVLEAVAGLYDHHLTLRRGLVGGAAIRATGVSLPDETLRLARETGATLLGAVGEPAFDVLPPEERPEKGLLALRKALGVFANLRPVKAWPHVPASPLKDRVVSGVDLVVVRELCGGLYYGTPRAVTGTGDDRVAVNTMTYSAPEIGRIARLAFRLARTRRGKVTSVDKANVLECSQLWRQVVSEVGVDFPDVRLEHALVDSCAMQLVTDPGRFDVLLTENMFGDILSDEAAVLAGSIGMLPSASLGAARGGSGPVGLFEPVHGSAPDIAGQGKANPLGAILSVALMLEHSFGLRREAAAIEHAVARVLEHGQVTADLRPAGTSLRTEEVGSAVVAALAGPPQGGAR